MRSQNNSEEKVPKKKMRKRRLIVWLLAAPVLVVLILFLVIPLYLSSQSGKNFVISKVNSLVDGRIQMGEFSMGWFKGVRLADFSFADNAGTTKVNVKEISTKPKYSSLLRGDIALGKTLIDTPEVILNIKKEAESKVVSPESVPERKEQKPIVLPLAQMDLEVRQGNATINTETAQQGVHSVHFQDIESKVAMKPPGSESNFAFSVAVADGAETPAKISANGTVTPAKSKGGWSLKGTNGDFKVVVDNLELETLEPLFILAGAEFGAKGNLNADIDVRVDDGRVGKLDAKATLADFTRAVAGKELVLAEPVELDAHLSSEADQVVIDKVQLRSSFCTLDCTGGINSVDYVAKADLKGLQDFAGQFVDLGGYSFAGNVVEKGNISFDKEKIAFNGQADITGFSASKAELKTAPTNAVIAFDMGVDTAESTMSISSLKLTSEPATVQVKADSVPLAKPDEAYFSAKVDGTVNLAKAQPFVALATELPEGLSMAGLLDSSITVEKKKEGYRIQTDATNIKNLAIAQPDVEPFEQEQINLTADILCDPEQKTVAINTLNLESKQDGSLIKVTKGTLTQSSKKDKTRLEGQLKAEYDLKTVSSITSAFVPAGLTMEGKRTASMEFASEYPTDQPEKLTENLNGTASFGFDRAEYMGLNIGAVNSEIEIKEGLLALKPFTTEVNDGKLTFGGNVDLRQQPLMLRTPGPMHIIENVNLNDRLSRSMLKFVNPMFANAVNVRGVADFYCDALAIPLKGAAKNDVVVEGTVGMKQLRMEASELLGQIISVAGGRGVDLVIRPTKFALKEGFLGYENMQVDVGNNPVNFKGRIGLDKTIDMTVELPYKIGGGTVKIDEIAGDRIALPIDGTLDSPRLNLEKALEGQLKNLLEDQLRKGIEKLFE